MVTNKLLTCWFATDYAGFAYVVWGTYRDAALNLQTVGGFGADFATALAGMTAQLPVGWET